VSGIHSQQFFDFYGVEMLKSTEG